MMCFRVLLLCTFLFSSGMLNGQHQLHAYLPGTWKNKAFNHKETWKHEGNVLHGFGLAMEGKDTLFYERLEINLTVNPVVYISWVTGQNGGSGIEFKLTESTDTSWVFENPLHDYPKKIMYIKSDNSNLEARISGSYKGTIREEQFRFSRETE
jgi:hypothetical protein